ncbi:transposase [Citrifermentans bremense]|uniref:transposase n=1 Tax=Citrifermentans bremense TaxID=60035 RepID=UPI000402C143|nr:transposase [Citrifermentans bremense]
MPRQSRIDGSGALHHIICRGIERRDVFNDNCDRDDFVERLGNILSETSTICYAWALIPNHFHLLLQTGSCPVSTIMSRLLTGYATNFNHRHNRHGHLFQNRYKSILCQEELYLLELVRYIHLNPLRAGIVTSLDELKRFRYSGHSRIVNQSSTVPWMATEQVLRRFSDGEKAAIRAYEKFISDGAALGKRDDLTGGGLLRSAGGWREVVSAREAGVFLKSDERILGDSDFVENVLHLAEEEMERKFKYINQGVDLERVADIVAVVLGTSKEDFETHGNQPKKVQARSLFCYWAVRELGATTTFLGHRLGMTQPAISVAVSRGEKLAAEMGLRLQDFINGRYPGSNGSQ